MKTYHTVSIMCLAAIVLAMPGGLQAKTVKENAVSRGGYTLVLPERWVMLEYGPDSTWYTLGPSPLQPEITAWEAELPENNRQIALLHCDADGANGTAYCEKPSKIAEGKTASDLPLQTFSATRVYKHTNGTVTKTIVRFAIVRLNTATGASLVLLQDSEKGNRTARNLLKIARSVRTK